MICKAPSSSNVLLAHDSCVGILGDDNFFSVTGLYDSGQVCVLLMTKSSLYSSPYKTTVLQKISSLP